MIDTQGLIAQMAVEAIDANRDAFAELRAHTNKCFAQQERRWREKWFPKPVPEQEQKSRLELLADRYGFAVWCMSMPEILASIYGGFDERFE